MIRSRGTADRIAALSETQRALLSKLTAEARLGSHRGPGGGGRLAAFITTDSSALDGVDPSQAELCDYLGERLPAYMVPSSFQFLDTFPLLPNGKIDLAAVSRLYTEPADVERPLLEPRNPVERTLAEIWRSVLEIDTVGAYDDFFELGGDSMLSIQVVSMAHEAGLALTPNDVLNFPILADLALRCSHSSITSTAADSAQDESLDPAASVRPEGGSRESVAAGEGEVTPELNRLPLFIVHGTVNMTARIRRYAGPHRPLYLFSSHWSDAKLDSDATMEQMAEEYLVELRTLQPKGPYYICGYSIGGPVAFEMAQSLARNGQKVGLLLLIDPPKLLRIHGAIPKVERGDPVSAASSTLSSGTESRRQKLGRHYDALSKMTVSEKGRYVWARIRHFIFRPIALKLSAARRILILRFCATCRNLNLSVPAAYRREYVRWVHHRAWRNYRPKPYGYDVLVIRAKESLYAEDLDSWANVVTGRFDVERFDGEHLDLVLNPETIDQWAPRLIELLEMRQMASVETANRR
jgi:thioesterase domain-containing protein